jgi:hypothetical protein
LRNVMGYVPRFPLSCGGVLEESLGTTTTLESGGLDHADRGMQLVVYGDECIEADTAK